MKKRRKRKKGWKGFKPACRDFAADLEALRDLACDHRLTVEVSVSMNRRRSTYHVMFKHGVTRVLDYWPATGTVWSMQTGEKGKVPDCWVALDEAARIAAGAMPQAVREQEQHLDAIAGRG